MPFGAIDGMIASDRAQIQQFRIPDVNISLASANPREFVAGFGRGEQLTKPMQLVAMRQNSLAGEITSLSGIRSRVLANIHSFICETYYKIAFSGAAESIFEQHQVAIDNLLRVSAPDVLEKIPSISDRLAAGDAEAISHAMNSCRRMIKALADSVYPASNVPVLVDGKSYEVGTDKVLNRIRLYLHDRCISESRRKRLNQNLSQIHEKASAGSHADITPGEARSIFLSTYLVLGEILDASMNIEPAAPSVETSGTP